jgi:glycosyltransferase involved in cell wall biosynthesis
MKNSKTLRVGIEASCLLVREKTGMEVYVTQLIRAMERFIRASDRIEFYFYYHLGSPYTDRSLISTLPSQSESFHSRFYAPRYGYRLALPMMVDWDRVHVLHLPVPVSMIYRRWPTIITFHDASWVNLPPDGQAIEGHHAQKLYDRAIAQSKCFIAVSKSAKSDLIRCYALDPEQVHVIHHGVDSIYRYDEHAAESVRHKYGLQKFILHVGGLQYRKNHVRMIQAYQMLHSSRGIPHDLVFVGRKGLGYQQIFDKAASSGLAEKIKFLDYVPEQDLPGFYSAADVFVYPSLHEGFGLPILEAFACGTVVVTSNCSSLPEVGGNAALYVDPYDSYALADTIFQAISDQHARREYTQRGLERVAQFSWEKTAQKTVELYRSLCNKSYDDE